MKPLATPRKAPSGAAMRFDTPTPGTLSSVCNGAERKTSAGPARRRFFRYSLDIRSS